jgi:hypothetical protein
VNARAGWAVAAGLVAALAAPAAPAADTAAAGAGAARVRHGLHVTLEPGRGWLTVSDTLEIPAALVRDGEAQFLLNGALAIRGAQPAVAEMPLHAAGARAGEDAARFFGINAAPADLDSAGQLKRYRVALPAGGGRVVLSYDGHFDFGLSDEKEQYTRGFRSTTGVISRDGVYLAGDGW